MQNRGAGLLFVMVIAVAGALADAAAASSKSRDSLKPSARTLLERADALHNSGDNPAALDAYMRAVEADPNAADLEAINRYAYPFIQSRDKLLAEKKRAALRQYLHIRPGDWEAAKTLVILVDLPEAESLLASFVESRPRDPNVYATRGHVRMEHHRYTAAIGDFAKATELDPQNAEHHYAVGVAEYEAVAKDSSVTEGDKRKRIERGLAELAKAEALKPEFPGSMIFRSLLLRESASLEKDPEAQKKLVAEANAARQAELERVLRARSEAQKTEDRSAAEGAPIEAPANWQHVTSFSGKFEYRLPSDWQKEGANSYRGSGGEALEQVYPAALINPEYCRSFRSFSSEDLRNAEVENRVYDNGHARGCFVVKDVINVKLNKQWRHTSFRFVTKRGVEDLTIIEPKEIYSARVVKTVVDSIRTK